MRNIKLGVWRVFGEGRAVLKEDTKYCSARRGLFASVALGQGGSKHTDLRWESSGVHEEERGTTPQTRNDPQIRRRATTGMVDEGPQPQAVRKRREKYQRWTLEPNKDRASRHSMLVHVVHTPDRVPQKGSP